MIRGSVMGFLITKKDLESGAVEKKRHKDIIEYWVHRQKESNFIDRWGAKLKLRNKENSFLHAIIVCSEERDVTEHDNSFLVRGIKFTDKDINEYLGKTNRRVD